MKFKNICLIVVATILTYCFVFQFGATNGTEKIAVESSSAELQNFLVGDKKKELNKSLTRVMQQMNDSGVIKSKSSASLDLNDHDSQQIDEIEESITDHDEGFLKTIVDSKREWEDKVAELFNSTAESQAHFAEYNILKKELEAEIESLNDLTKKMAADENKPELQKVLFAEKYQALLQDYYASLRLKIGNEEFNKYWQLKSKFNDKIKNMQLGETAIFTIDF